LKFPLPSSPSFTKGWSMYTGQSVFSQVMAHLPLRRFHTCVKRYRGNYKAQRFSCLDQFLVMAFAQLTYRESLRDIEACLRAMQPKLYHMGIRSRVSRNTLAHANETRDWRIYADFAQILIEKARRLYADEDFGQDLHDATLYALDATTIDLCLSLFPWARFRRAKGAVKLHTLMDLRGSIPSFIHISDGKLHDVNVLDLLLPEPGAYYVMDRAYLDFKRLFRLHRGQAFFITRHSCPRQVLSPPEWHGCPPRTVPESLCTEKTSKERGGMSHGTDRKPIQSIATRDSTDSV